MIGWIFAEILQIGLTAVSEELPNRPPDAAGVTTEVVCVVEEMRNEKLDATGASTEAYVDEKLKRGTKTFAQFLCHDGSWILRIACSNFNKLKPRNGRSRRGSRTRILFMPFIRAPNKIEEHSNEQFPSSLYNWVFRL